MCDQVNMELRGHRVSEVVRAQLAREVSQDLQALELKATEVWFILRSIKDLVQLDSQTVCHYKIFYVWLLQVLMEILGFLGL